MYLKETELECVNFIQMFQDTVHLRDPVNMVRIFRFHNGDKLTSRTTTNFLGRAFVARN
jgi:hypothetical protein